MKSFVNDLNYYDYTGELAENKEEESGNDEYINIKLSGDENATNENKENAIEIDYLFMYPFLFQIVLNLRKKNFFINNFPKLSQ